LDKEFEAKQKQRRASKMALEEQWKGNRDIHQPASSSTSGGFFSRIFRSSSDDGSAKRKRSSARLAKLADEVRLGAEEIKVSIGYLYIYAHTL
jgi:hypothetical protein